MRVALCGFDGAVSGYLLNDGKVYAIFEHVRKRAVAY